MYERQLRRLNTWRTISKTLINCRAISNARRNRHRNLSRGIGDLPITPNPRWRWNSSSHLLLYQDTTWSLSQVDKKSLNTSIPLMSPLPLRRGRREPLTINTAASPQSSWRARRRQSPEPSRRRQPPRVTSQRRLLGVPPSASRITKWCKCTRNPQSLTRMQSQAKSVREWVRGSQMSSMYARNGQESPHTWAPPLNSSHYVQLAQLLRMRGRSALYDQTVQHTGNNFSSHLKHVSAVRKSQAQMVR